MLSQEIRRNFLKFFKERHHTIVPSSSVVPHDDPTLLFINAGMNQFKDVFLGKSLREYTRAATAQKCIRVGGKHNDLDNVGHTTRHLTFFEMLGNFSFGDYFKEQAIGYAWQLSTEVFGFDPARIWITIFEDDEEAFSLWKQIVPESKIVRMGEKDNFWAMGDTGPCGPCSELYYDKGEKYGTARSPKEDIEGNRYLEFWNLVFMQFNRDANSTLNPLPKKSIDTGAGLERIISLKLGIESLFGTDILRSLIAQVEQISGVKYAPNSLAAAFHVIADHIRSLAFAIADGAQPSNVERGYILRKLLRRAVRYGRMLGLQDPFLSKLLPRLIDLMGQDYHELTTTQTRIAEVLTTEEEAFIRTLKRGGNILHNIIDKAEHSAHKQISGEDAFKLKDTYGFPLEEILLIAKDSGLQVNLDTYQLLEEQAKERSRSAHLLHTQQVEESIFKEHLQVNGPCHFLGYAQTQCEAKITGIVVDTVFTSSLREGQEGIILLDCTPFYAEKGGQVADTGTLSQGASSFSVTDCHSPYPGVVAHRGKLTKGELSVKEKVVAKIDSNRRESIACNHTATHLLHWALQQVLGPHIQQAGSLVDSLRLRFDFNHHKALSKEELRHIERLVNQKIRENKAVKCYEISFEEAQKHKEIKQFFGEKYGTRVRVVDIDYSKELCGGTHVDEVGNIGLFRITKEGSISAGVRRIEAVTGAIAESVMYETEDLVDKAATLLKSTPAKLIERLHDLNQENKELAHSLKQLKKISLKQSAKELIDKVENIGPLALIAASVAIDADLVNDLIEEIFALQPSAVVLLGLKEETRCQLIAKVSCDWVDKGIYAVEIIKEIAPCVAGSGGGKKNHAQAGGKNPEGLFEAFEKARQWLKKKRAS